MCSFLVLKAKVNNWHSVCSCIGVQICMHAHVSAYASVYGCFAKPLVLALDSGVNKMLLKVSE